MLQAIDLSLAIHEGEYLKTLRGYQKAAFTLGNQVHIQQQLVVLIFEGWDASGKGGVIRRLSEEMDPRDYIVFATGAAEGEEARHHYLWRFWRHLPESGQIAIFDRSWYRRVLVERVEEICSPAEWKRAYREINQFERQLVDFGTILIKFWLQVSKEEQLRRFEDRQADPLRQWKVTQEEWRNREKWDLYEEAVNEMLLKTHTHQAPWTLIEAESKHYARLRVLQVVVEKLSEALQFDPFASRETFENRKGKSAKGKKKKR